MNGIFCNDMQPRKQTHAALIETFIISHLIFATASEIVSECNFFFDIMIVPLIFCTKRILFFFYNFYRIKLRCRHSQFKLVRCDLIDCK